MADQNSTQTMKPETGPKEAEKQQLKDTNETKEIIANGVGNHHNTAADVVSPTTSRNSNSNSAKKSYKGALVKEDSNNTNVVDSSSQQPSPSSSSSPAESNKDKETTSTNPSTENVPADSQKNKPTVAATPNNTIVNKPPSVAPWKKQAMNRKKKTDGEGESLTDLAAWPSLDQVKTTEIPKEKKTKEGKSNEGTDQEGPLSPTTEKPEGVEPTSPTESQSSKKKGVNWVPLPVEIDTQSRQHNTGMSRGRGGRGPRRMDGQPGQQQIPNGNSPANTSRSWRSQGQNQNQRGSRRGGRGGYTNGRGYVPPSTVYYHTLEGENLKQAIQKQVEYYFSVENLCKDMYLRSQMDQEGWVPLSVIAVFHRLLSLTTDVKMLAESIEGSTVLECKDDKIRRKEDWKTWLPKPAETSNVVQ